ncbi:MAG TPA: type I 3-dehydroquinate dehydratase, partial [Pyrinomonadaceae bacterium]
MISETNKARVCVPVCVRNAGELRPSVARAAELADIVELRLDCLEEDQLAAALSLLGALLGETPLPFIITYRPRDQGGGRDVSLEERADFWRELPEALRDIEGGGRRGRDFVDLELDLLESPRAGSLGELFKRFRVICSRHDFEETPAELEELFARMARTRAEILKVATKANSITDCVEVLRLCERGRREGREVIAVSMGEAGMLTRVLAPAFGAFLTYASLDAAQATAPGQISARELREVYRVDALNARTLVAGLVGSPVGHSLSPHTHNAAFAATGLDAVYVPFEVTDLSEFVRRMADPRTRELGWNLRGLSVTAPHKQAVIPHLDRVSENASRVGAVNTVVVSEERGLEGYNTDASAALAPLERMVAERVFDLCGASAAVIGAGGAARAVLWALGEWGAWTTVFARDAAKAHAVAEEFGAEWDELEGARFGRFEVVINATPLGTRGSRETETPARASQLRG